MAGLLEQQEQGMTAEQPGMVQPGMEQAMQPEQGEMSREQMGEVEELVAMARSIIIEGDVLTEVVDSAQERPVDTLSETVVAVIQKIQESRGQLDPPVALGIGIVMIGDIADALQRIGLPEFSPQDLNEAVQESVVLWLKLNESSLDPAKMQQYQGELQGLAGGMQ